MSVLTHEVAKALRDRVNANDPLELIRATEQAVLSKLAAGVSVEPFFWVYEAGTPGGYFIEVDRTRKDGNYRDEKCWEESPVFTELQLAAARVQMANEIMELPQIKGNLFAERAIRALIGGAT
jgi:hypothetical protein